MHATSLKRRLGVIATTAVLLAAVLATAPVSAAATPKSGLVCTQKTGSSPVFDLYANDGYVTIPDGNSIYMWSFHTKSGKFQLPGPTLCVKQGDHVTVRLHNELNTVPSPVEAEDVSIVFPGQMGVTADDVPVAPQYDTGELVSLVQSAVPGGMVSYEFDATEPGTYLYESGTDPVKQVQMGLFGALMVRPTLGATYAYNDAASKFKAGKEYLMLLSEIDPALHQAVERGEAYQPSSIHNRYWMINGRSFPDTIAPNGASWLPYQPYSALIHINPFDAAANPDPALLRYVNVGSLNHPFHPHGNHGRVIARDGRLLKSGSDDLSYEKFTVLVGAGQTWDSTYRFTDVEHWSPDTNPIPVSVPQLQNLIFKDDATWYSGSPYLGESDELPTGVTSFNQCGEYYHVAHSHALQEAANFDAGFGGMLTLIRIDPPTPNTCP